jgi:hypothetical protein
MQPKFFGYFFRTKVSFNFGPHFGRFFHIFKSMLVLNITPGCKTAFPGALFHMSECQRKFDFSNI